MTTDNLTLADRGRSLVWSRESGSNVIIIIDDDYHFVGYPNPFPAKSAYAHGLYATFKHAVELPATRAVGFFHMPQSVSLVKDRLLPDIESWIAEIGEECQFYFLVDVYFGPVADEDMAVGPSVIENLSPSFPHAKFAFLSQAGWGSIGGNSGKLINHNVFIKSKIEELANTRQTLPTELLQWLDAITPQLRASTWELDTWKRVRKESLRICRKLGNPSEVGHKYWAHHLPYGGDGYLWTDKDKVHEWTKALKEGLTKVAPEIDAFPDHGWQYETEGGVQGWDKPPLRAIAQFDSPGKDLSAAIYLIKKDVRRIALSDTKIRFASSLTMQPETLKHDYLWFNVSALAKGLFTLGQSFRGEVNKVVEGTRTLDDLPVPCYGGRIFWSISEVTEGENCGLSIDVHQYLIGWSVEAELQQWPCFMRAKYALPQPRDAAKAVQEAYDYIERCGAQLAVNDGTLNIRIKAKVVQDEDNPKFTRWEVEI
jgi:hypothetical protein